MFDGIVERLGNCAGILIGKKQIGPSEDFYKCTIDGLDFTLFYDIDYGAFIYAEDLKTRGKEREELQKQIDTLQGAAKE